MWLRCRHFRDEVNAFPKLYPSILLTKETWGLCLWEATRLPRVFTFTPGALRFPRSVPSWWLAPDGNAHTLRTPVHDGSRDVGGIAPQVPGKQVDGVHSPQAALCKFHPRPRREHQAIPALFPSDCTGLDFYSFLSCLLLDGKSSQVLGNRPVSVKPTFESGTRGHFTPG